MLRNLFIAIGLGASSFIALAAEQNPPDQVDQTSQAAPQRRGHAGRVQSRQQPTSPMPSGVSRPPRQPAARPAYWGIKVKPVPQLLRAHLPGLLVEHLGLVVTEVQVNLPAEAVGLKPADILVDFGVEQTVVTGEHERALPVDSGQSMIGLNVIRAGRPRRLTAIPRHDRGSAETASARAINVSSRDGSVSLAGVNGRFELNADFVDRSGRRQRLNATGRQAEIEAKLQLLPCQLRDLVRRQLRDKPDFGLTR